MGAHLFTSKLRQVLTNMARKHLKPQFYDDDEDLDQYLQQNKPEDSENDEMETLSFGSIKSAQKQLDNDEEQRKHYLKQYETPQKKPVKSIKKKRPEPQYESEPEQGSDSEGFFDSEDDSEAEQSSRGNKKSKRSKHAPKETSSKKAVKRIRQIPGLENKKESTLYTDVRFDAAFGKADVNRIRKDYKFLDDYRESEIKEIQSVLKNPKVRNGLDNDEVEELEYESKSLKSRLDTLKNRELQQKVLDDYKKKMNSSSTGGKYYLKKSEQRKIIQKHKYDSMKSSQREKVIERKRKRRLGKEFKQLEFNRPRD
jgi:ribosomal RNA-processing protein 36